ncbi:hypothetical protein DFH07DRAFT_413796 [Mycena maculata]|uniref:Uncharacterized protein n=1 Tax=Mycena maculata TaxID=230809 RepID=A0AAD7NII5_9AGAR|nr:hypothetical protein DFH07DRAFT_413796 [Mycena maculata]
MPPNSSAAATIPIPAIIPFFPSASISPTLSADAARPAHRIRPILFSLALRAAFAPQPELRVPGSPPVDRAGPQYHPVPAREAQFHRRPPPAPAAAGLGLLLPRRCIRGIGRPDPRPLQRTSFPPASLSLADPCGHTVDPQARPGLAVQGRAPARLFDRDARARARTPSEGQQTAAGLQAHRAMPPRRACGPRPRPAGRVRGARDGAGLPEDRPSPHPADHVQEQAVVDAGNQVARH